MGDEGPPVVRGDRSRGVHPDRDVRALFALGGASSAAFLPFFVLLLRHRGFAPDEIGVVLAASALAGVAATPVWSHVADTRLGGVRTLQASTIAEAAAALALLATGSHVWATVAVAAVLGVASGPATALSDTIALGHLGSGRETEYGTIRLWASIGWAVAVIAFGAWFERAGLAPLLPAYAVGLLAYAAVTTRFPAMRPERRAEPRSRLGSVGEAFRAQPRLLPFLAGLLLVSTATSASWSFVPLRIVSRGGGPFLVGIAAGLAAVVEIPFFRGSAWLGERAGLRTLYAAGCGIYVAMMVAWALVASPTVVALVKIASGAGFGLIYAALVVITGRLVPAHLQNTGQALMQTFGSGIGPIVGSALGGLVYARLGPPTLFAGAAVLVAVGAALVWATLSEEAFSRAGA